MSLSDSGDGREIVLAEEVVERLLQEVLHGLVLVEADLFDLAGDLGIEECGDGLLADPGGRDGAGGRGPTAGGGLKVWMAVGVVGPGGRSGGWRRA